MQDWATDKEAAYTTLEQKWVDAWRVYQDGIAQPWSDFLVQSEALSMEGK